MLSHPAQGGPYTNTQELPQHGIAATLSVASASSTISNTRSRFFQQLYFWSDFLPSDRSASAYQLAVLSLQTSSASATKLAVLSLQTIRLSNQLADSFSSDHPPQQPACRSFDFRPSASDKPRSGLAVGWSDWLGCRIITMLKAISHNRNTGCRSANSASHIAASRLPSKHYGVHQK